MKKWICILILFIILAVFLVHQKVNVLDVSNKNYKIYLNGALTTSYPSSSSNYSVDVQCENGRGYWDYENWNLLIDEVKKDTVCSVFFTSVANKMYLNNYILSLEGIDQGSGKVVHETFTDSSGNLVDTGYRYEGKNPNNYISFNNELWRIIGVFDTTLADGQTVKSLTKIIRAESIGGLKYGTDNAWTTTSNTRGTLNDLLNNYYYQSLDGTNSDGCYGYSTGRRANCNYESIGIKSGYRSMIEEVTWHLGGMTSSSSDAANYWQNPASTWYSYERGSTTSSVSATTGVGHIGLMYGSDYGYAVLESSCARITKLSQYGTAACGGQNWLYGNGYEWTITPHSNSTSEVFSVHFSGRVVISSVGLGYAIRPVLYLSSTVYVTGGDGTASSPYIIKM